MKKINQIMLAAVAVSMLASCGGKGDEVTAPKTFGDSIATYVGIGEGITMNQAIAASDSASLGDFNKEQFVAGLKYILLADTSASFRQGMSMAMNYMNVFNQAQAAGIEVNKKQLVANFEKQFLAEKADEEELARIRPTLDSLMGEMDMRIRRVQLEQQQRMNAMMNQMYEANVAAGKAAFEQIKGDSNVKTTASGLSYKIERQGTGAVAKDGQEVKVVYTGRLVDGTVFDSSEGQAVPFSTSDVIPGFKEALTTFPAGTKATIYIPQELGYGMNGSERIQPGSYLIFDIEIAQ